MSRFFSSLRALSKDRRGNVAMMWGITAMALLAMIGTGIDFSRANSSRQSLQNAADGAALVAERMADKPFAERQAAAEQYFRASIADLYGAETASIRIEEKHGGGHRASATMPVPSSMTRLFSDRDLVVGVSADADQDGSSLEVALVLDVTGSMSGQRIADLRAATADLVDIVVRDEQEPYYSKVALVPYSAGVNVGAYAAQVRGPVVASTPITDATWRDGAAKTITGATRANPVVITSAAHGLSDGDFVRITGVNGMTQVNNKIYTVADRTANTFKLSGVNGSAYNNYTSGGSIQKCFGSNCDVQVTAAGHGLANNSWVVISGVQGMTQINNVITNSATAAQPNAWEVVNATANTFVLRGSKGPSYGAYTTGGRSDCTVAGCEFLRFNDASASAAVRVHRINSCVSERTGVNATTDVAPNVTFVGRNYGHANNACTDLQITPMTSDKADLTSKANALVVSGSTAGHIGLAWGWYMLSPNFAYLWPEESRGRPYGSPNLRKFVVMMTDGAYNTPYCNGVISRDGYGNASERINCNAPNGSSFAQAAALCTAIKNSGVSVYTVGFAVGNDATARAHLRSCASSPAQFFEAANGTELRNAFRDIATAISQLRLSK
ncbi:MAG: ubiquitin-activating E1 FCCH domain-containing protein [Hyphomonadaceae bacterium]|nr:ubiquitin-activating E1 FCCH domain-containing protein [Hyphomonadaceae bacterium]